MECENDDEAEAKEEEEEICQPDTTTISTTIETSTESSTISEEMTPFTTYMSTESTITLSTETTSLSSTDVWSTGLSTENISKNIAKIYIFAYISRSLFRILILWLLSVNKIFI